MTAYQRFFLAYVRASRERNNALTEGDWYLANEKAEAQRLYSLYFDETSKQQMYINIVRKSIYEYYVGLKFRIQEESQTSSIFARNRGEVRREFSLDELEQIITEIENRWVSD